MHTLTPNDYRYHLDKKKNNNNDDASVQERNGFFVRKNGSATTELTLFLESSTFHSQYLDKSIDQDEISWT